MDQSILNTIKKLLGLAPDYTAFDSEVVVYINSVLMTLNQIGIGPDEGFTITGPDELWTEFIPNEVTDQQGIPTYIYLKVNIKNCKLNIDKGLIDTLKFEIELMFDPPTSSFGQEAIKKQAEEIEWRLNVQSPEFEKESGIS